MDDAEAKFAALPRTPTDTTALRQLSDDLAALLEDYGTVSLAVGVREPGIEGTMLRLEARLKAHIETLEWARGGQPIRDDEPAAENGGAE